FGMRLGTGHDYAITQSVMWNELGMREYVTSPANPNWATTVNYINDINAKINRYHTRPSIHFGNYELNVGDSITLTDTNGVLSDYDVTSTGGLQVTQNGNNVTITALANSNDNASLTFTNRITKELQATNINIVYTRPGNQTAGSFTATDPMRAELRVKVNKFGSLAIQKSDAETGNNPQGDATFAGAKFGVYRDAATTDLIQELVLDHNGHAQTAQNLSLNKNVYVKEIAAPTGYLLDSTVRSAMIDSATNVINMNVPNTVKKGDLEIQKIVDATWIKNKVKKGRSSIKDPGVGFQFNVTHDKTGTLVGTMTTDAAGFASLRNLPYGWYTVSEQASEGYDTLAPFRVLIDTDKKVYKYNIENTVLRAWVQLVKKDADTGKTVPLAGYKFKIKDKNGNYVKQHLVYPTQMDIDTFITAADGSCTLPEKLIYGTYYLEEVAVEGDYVRNPNPVEFKVDGTIATVVVEMPNIAVTGQLNLKKIDQETKEALGGVTYQLTASDTIYTKGYEVDGEGNRLIAYKKGDSVSMDISEDGHYVTDETGEIHINNLPLGKYAIKEIKNLDGYILDTKTHEFELKYQDDQTEIIVHDLELTNKKTKVEIEKLDTNYEKQLVGAELKILDTAGNVVDAWTTTKDNHIIKGLTVGQTYILREDYAPQGYMIAKDVTFKVTGEATQKVIMKDPRMQVDKVDAITGEKLDGSILTITSTKTKQIVDRWTSEADETHYVNNLIEGETYILHEEKAPVGFYFAEDITFTATDKKLQQIIVKDAPILKDAHIKKVDSLDHTDVLHNATFTLFADKECTQILKSEKSGEDGIATFKDLRYGTYYAKETAAPAGYLLSDEVVKIEINDQTENDYTIIYENTLLEDDIVTTADATNVSLLLGGVLVSGFGLIFLKKKRKSN
ncbi:MAG: SpaA isopeptide-forming pilin-related protein, partial [Erysipelotrichaceae bacterium]